MRERVVDSSQSLVFFTVFAQAAAGVAFLGALEGDLQHGVVALILLGVGALAAYAHLGRPGRAYRALAGIRTSALSREVLGVGLFGLCLLLWPVTPIPAAIAGLLLVAEMSRLYRLRTVPAWNSWTTPAAFFGTSVVLGGAIVGGSLIGTVLLFAIALLVRYRFFAAYRRVGL